MWVSDPGVCGGVWVHSKTAAPSLGCDLCRLVADSCSCTAGGETGQAAGFSAINQSSLAWPSLPYSTLTSGAPQLNFTPLKSHHTNITVCFLSYTLVLEAKNKDCIIHNQSSCSSRVEQNIEFKNLL